MSRWNWKVVGCRSEYLGGDECEEVVREPVMVWQSVEASEVGKTEKSIIDAFLYEKAKVVLF